MTAVASPRNTEHRPTRRNSSAAHSAAADYSDVPVLLRIPNLDRPAATDSRFDEPFSAPAEEEASPSARKSRTRHSSSTVESVANTSAVKPTEAPKVLSILWRAGIVVAAIGLVVLAYRIINGPPTADEGSAADMYSSIEDATPTISVPTVTMGDATPLTPNSLADDLAAPKFATPELATPLVNAPSHTTAPPITSNAQQPEPRVPSVAPQDSQRNPAEIATHRNPTPNWDTSRAVESNGVEARPWSESNVANGDFAAGSRDDNQQRPWANGELSRGDFTGNPPSNGYRQTGTASNSSYPETDPRSWRTPEQWDEAAFVQPGGEPNYDTWQENSRSAQLRPEIEQPPLRR